MSNQGTSILKPLPYALYPNVELGLPSQHHKPPAKVRQHWENSTDRQVTDKSQRLLKWSGPLGSKTRRQEIDLPGAQERFSPAILRYRNGKMPPFMMSNVPTGRHADNNLIWQFAFLLSAAVHIAGPLSGSPVPTLIELFKWKMSSPPVARYVLASPGSQYTIARCPTCNVNSSKRAYIASLAVHEPQQPNK